jgi:hypothetical protein
VQANGDWTIAGVTDAVVPKDGLILDQPRLSWTNLGKTVQLHGVGNPENYTVDAYGLDGRVLGQHLNFNGNGIAVIPGNGSAGPVALKLHGNGTRNLVAGSARAMTDSSADSGVVYIIVTDPNGNTDTLREIPVTSWTSVLGTQYVVQRNVDVTTPYALAGDIVKVGWYNIYTNPSNYYSIRLGNPNDSAYSGFIYTAYDSASYGSNAYLFSAIALIENSKDSVVAFSKDVSTITSLVGNFSFAPTRFVNGIISVTGDSLTVPWYAFNISNGDSVTAYKSVVKTLDSTASWKDSLIVTDSSGWFLTNSNGSLPAMTYRDTTYKIGDTTYHTSLDSVDVHFTGGSPVDTFYLIGVNIANDGLMITTTPTVTLNIAIPSTWTTQTTSGGYHFFSLDAEISAYTKVSFTYAYKTTKTYFK